jgi:hypothetical protein
VVREEAKDRAMNATDRTPEELIAKFRKVSRAKPGNTIYEDGVFGISYPLTGSAADRLTPAKLRQIINRERRKAKRRQGADDALREGLIQG